MPNTPKPERGRGRDRTGGDERGIRHKTSPRGVLWYTVLCYFKRKAWLARVAGESGENRISARHEKKSGASTSVNNGHATLLTYSIPPLTTPAGQTNISSSNHEHQSLTPGRRAHSGQRLLLAERVETPLVDVHELPRLQGEHAGAKVQLQRQAGPGGEEKKNDTRTTDGDNQPDTNSKEERQDGRSDRCGRGHLWVGEESGRGEFLARHTQRTL